MMVQFSREFEEICVKKFEPDSKIGILSSVSPEGYPHLALITSISVKTKKTLMWGQFSRGLSKTYLADNPRTGFLVVSPGSVLVDRQDPPFGQRGQGGRF